MADPQLSEVFVKPGPRVQVFRTLIEIVKSYQPLKDSVQLWIEGNGEPADRTPYSLSVLPAIRFRPYTVGLDEIYQNRRRISFGVYVDVFTKGLHFDDFLNIWDAIEDSVVVDRTLESGKTVFNTLHALNECKGPQQVIVQQDVCRDLTSGKEVIGRYGSGHIMLPFNKGS